MLTSILYDLVMHLAQWSQSLARLFNEKARKRYFGLAETSYSLSKGGTKAKRVLIHCASYGEFEQIKPLIERIKSEHKAVVVASFFSPSGFEMASDYSQVDEIVYLPIDTKSNMDIFVNKIKPDLVLLVKYEIWLNFMDVLYQKKIPVYLVSGLFLAEYIYFKKIAGIFRTAFKKLDGILVQNTSSKTLLSQYKIDSEVCGDSRADRVLERSQFVNSTLNKMVKWKGDEKLLILGSVWPEGWALFKTIIADLSTRFKIVIAPHELSRSFIDKIVEDVGQSEQWSKLKNQPAASTRILILDTIGLLADSYRYGDVAYVGGAFKQGLHNVFEPAIYGMPIVFGPQIGRFPEASALIELNAATCVDNAVELKDFLDRIAKNENLRVAMAERARDFVLASTGSSKRIYNHIKKHLS